MSYKRSLAKGAKAVVTTTENGYYVEVSAFGRLVGKFSFDRSKNLVKKFIIEKYFYPLDLAIYEVSKKRVYKRRKRVKKNV
jgi:hypothetical protein